MWLFVPMTALAAGSSALSDDDDDAMGDAPSVSPPFHNLLTSLFNRRPLLVSTPTPLAPPSPEDEEEAIDEAVQTKRPRRGGKVPSSSLRTGLPIVGWGVG